MTKPTFTPVIAERITELFGLFKLPTLASETVAAPPEFRTAA